MEPADGKSHAQLESQHMIYFHTTDAAKEILRNGFRDSTGSYMFANLVLTGVWLGDQIMDIDEGAVGNQGSTGRIPR